MPIRRRTSAKARPAHRPTHADAWVGPWLRRLRLARTPADRLTAVTVAARLGTDPGTVSRFETGRLRIPVDRQPDLIRAYGITHGAWIDELNRRMGGGAAHLGSGSGG